MNPEATNTDNNFWIAIALSAVVLIAWYGFIDKKINPPPLRASTSPSAAPGSPATDPVAASPLAPSSVAPTQDAAAALATSADVRLGDFDARINSRGAALSSFIFKDSISSADLVADPAAGFFSTWPDLTFVRDLGVKNGIAYAAVTADGVRLTKEFMPGQGILLPRLVITARNPTRKPITLDHWSVSVGPGLGTLESERKDNVKVTRVIGLTPESQGLHGRVETLKAGAHPFPYRWVAVDNRYFLAAVIASAKHFVPIVHDGSPARLDLVANPVVLKPGAVFAWEIPYYLGPKGHLWLSHYGIGLERAIDFGFFAPIGRALLSALLYAHDAIGNWGWAIILLTLGLQLILLPLTYRSLKAAAAMKRLQPEIARLQKRYADDSQRMNTEMMQLYKKEGANPLGGCLPMLLQMPIFVALYNALRNSWELHGAGWAFWIHDLSVKDPYYVLPLVMGGLMFAQSKLNPPAGDPAQQQMMAFMPIIFTFMFLNFPSGLVLYWLTNSLVSTVLQLGLKNHFEKTA